MTVPFSDDDQDALSLSMKVAGMAASWFDPVAVYGDAPNPTVL